MLRRKTTPESLAANRANAKLSTGPRSAQGQRHSSLNSLKHGLLAAKPIFHSDEERTRFSEIRTRLFDDLAPVGILEVVLTEDIANLSWKLLLNTDWEFRESDRLMVSGEVLDQLFARTNFSVDLRAELANHWSVLELGVSATDNNTEAARKADEGAQVFGGGTKARSSEAHSQGESKQKSGTCTTDVRFARSLDLAKRYQARIRADLHAAIRELKNLQAARKANKCRPPTRQT